MRAWKGHRLPWYRWPLRCVLGIHQWRRHPHVPIVAMCNGCHLERSIAHQRRDFA